VRFTGLIRSVAVLAAGCAGAGTILWPVPYADVSLLESAFVVRWLVAAAIAGFAGRWFARFAAPRTAALVAAGFGLATSGRIVVEVAADPTNHNLWPVEIAIALAIGFAGSMVGALLAPRGSVPSRTTSPTGSA